MSYVLTIRAEAGDDMEDFVLVGRYAVAYKAHGLWSAPQASIGEQGGTVPGKASDDLAPGTLNSILKQAGLRDG